MENLKKFEREWKNVKDKSGHCILNNDAMKEIKNVKLHILKGCLSGIPHGCGIKRNERLNKYLNEFLSTNKMSVSLAHARCFKLFAELSSMKETRADHFMSFNLAKLNKDQTYEKLETFGLRTNLVQSRMSQMPQPRKLNKHYVEEQTTEAASRYIHIHITLDIKLTDDHINGHNPSTLIT